MRYGVKSDKGMIREINEDSYGIVAGYSGVPVSFIIADGMGGHNSGEIASKMAVDIVTNSLLRTSEDMIENENIPEMIERFMKEANADIYNASMEQKSNYGMGTTLITAIIYRDRLYIGHIGDSRAYIIRDNRMERITTDHSFIEELIKSGTLTREEADKHPKKNVITRALGCSEDIQVDTYINDIRQGDIFLLCTDGLTNMVNEDEILRIAINSEDPEAACTELVDSANSCGGNDNITVIIIKND